MVRMDAAKFAEWLLTNAEKCVAGHHTLCPTALFFTAQGRGRADEIARYCRETNVVLWRGEYHPLPQWVADFEANLAWRVGNGKPVPDVDTALKALEDALWMECVRVSVRKKLSQQ